MHVCLQSCTHTPATKTNHTARRPDPTLSRHHNISKQARAERPLQPTAAASSCTRVMTRQWAGPWGPQVAAGCSRTRGPTMQHGGGCQLGLTYLKHQNQCMSNSPELRISGCNIPTTDLQHVIRQMTPHTCMQPSSHDGHGMVKRSTSKQTHGCCRGCCCCHRCQGLHACAHIKTQMANHSTKRPPRKHQGTQPQRAP